MNKRIILVIALLVLFLSAALAADANDDSNAIATVCADSDGGIKEFVYGTVEGTDYKGRSFRVDDYCINDIVLVEKYCTDQDTHGKEYGYSFVDVGCLDLCQDGTCIKKTEQDYNIIGTIDLNIEPKWFGFDEVKISIDGKELWSDKTITDAPLIVYKTPGVYQVTIDSLLYNDVSATYTTGVFANRTTTIYAGHSPTYDVGIFVKSFPGGADVWLDDVLGASAIYVGQTIESNIPGEGYLWITTPIGKYDVTITKDGYETYKTTTEVKSQQSYFSEVEAKLDKIKSGNIKVTSNPSKADVYIGTRYAGMTPLSLTQIAPGSYKVLVKKKGYKDYSKTVVVKANRTTPVHAKLTKISTKKTSAKTTGAVTASISKVKCSAKSIIGDADGSKSITPGDSLLITNITLGTEPKPSNICCVDVDNDKDVDSSDAQQVFDYYLGTQKSGNIGTKCSEVTVKTGKLKVTSSPSKADAYIRKSGVDEWSFIGKTPVTKSKVGTGSYEVSVKKKGYLESRQTVSVSANRTTPLHLKLLKETEAKCTDSDGGRDYYVQGVAKGIVNGLETFADDTCLDITKKDYLVDGCSGSNCYLNEGYCEGSTPVYESWVPCTNGCNDGACLKEATTCTDSDGGKDYYVKGIADARVNGIGNFGEDRCSSYEGGKGGLESIVESCSGSNCYLTEGYCEGSNPLYESWISCTNGCKDGACMK